MESRRQLAIRKMDSHSLAMSSVSRTPSTMDGATALASASPKGRAHDVPDNSIAIMILAKF